METQLVFQVLRRNLNQVSFYAYHLFLASSDVFSVKESKAKRHCPLSLKLGGLSWCPLESRIRGGEELDLHWGVYLHLPNSHLGTVLMVCITSSSEEPVGQVQALLLGGKQDSERTFPSHHETEFVFSNRVSSFYGATCHVWQSPVVSKIPFGLGTL